MTRTHVLMTTDAVGGVWQYSTDLARELAKSGYRISLAIIGPSPDDAQRRHAEAIEGVRLLDTGRPLDWMCDHADQVRQTAREIARLARDCGADLVHCNSPALVGAADFPVPVLSAAHGCISTWWQAAKEKPLDPKFRWHGEMMRRGLNCADAVVAPSKSFAATVQSTYRLSNRPLVVHNGRSAATASTSRHRLNVALTVGRMWDPVKNGALLDRAAAEIDMPFLAAGTLRGPNGEEISFSQIRPLGQIASPGLAELLALEPIFVSAATFEPFGLAVLEAASAGCALVLSDIPTFRELWDGVALFADPADEHAFAAQINRLKADPELRQKLGDEARLRSTRYTTQAMGKAMASIYRTLQTGQEAAA